jgi:hypothetical protein
MLQSELRVSSHLPISVVLKYHHNHPVLLQAAGIQQQAQVTQTAPKLWLVQP